MKSVSEDMRDGRRYHFPECCVLAFCARGGTANASQALDYGICTNKGNPFVPCHVYHFPDIPLWRQEIFDGDT